MGLVLSKNLSCVRPGHENNRLILNRANGTQLTGNLFCMNGLLDITNIIHLAMSRGQLLPWVKLGSVIQTAGEDFYFFFYWTYVMQMEKSESEILQKSGTWITAENSRYNIIIITDVRLLSIQKKFFSGYTFSSAQYKVLPRRMSFSLASQVPHYNSHASAAEVLVPTQNTCQEW